jgi:diguanylate cyclase (GGDEF)-like protein
LAEAAEPLLGQAISREELAADRDRFAREARMDPLTGLENRTAWQELIAIEEARQGRYKRPLTIISVDIDNLKSVNDRFGHEAGDCLIQQAADLLRQTARKTDRIARVGGDEFLILMPETDEAGGERFLSRMHTALETFGYEGLSLSLGAATALEGEALKNVIIRADGEMYASRKRRRHQSDPSAAA